MFGMLDGKPVQARPISTYPPVKQDLAFTVPTSVSAAQLAHAIRDAAGDELEDIHVFDVFTGGQLGEGVKSLAFSVTFRAMDRTLTAQDSERIRGAIVDAARSLGARLRA